VDFRHRSAASAPRVGAATTIGVVIARGHHRDPGVWRLAEDYADYYLEKGNYPMANPFLENYVGRLEGVTPDALQKMRYSMMAGSRGFPILGDADKITVTLQLLWGGRIDGTLLRWIDYKQGLEQLSSPNCLRRRLPMPKHMVPEG